MSLNAILKSQKAWAAGRPGRGHILDRIEDNLFRPLHPATYAEFARGSGDELGLNGRTAKMRSLRSSSTLTCNVFDAWRDRPLAPLVSALGLKGAYTELAFEHKLPHGLSTTPPNIDVIFSGRDCSPVGIEAKFAEPYGKKKHHPPIDEKYFANGRKRWAELGLTKSQAAGEEIGRSQRFHRLQAGQLLKHILGLANTFRHIRPVRLRYLWYDIGGEEADAHRAEIGQFAKLIVPEVDFAAIRFQELFARLMSVEEPVDGYISYLQSRYFAA